MGHVPHGSQRTALGRSHNGEDGLQGHHDEDGDAHLGVERVKGIEAVDGDGEGRDHAEDSEDLGGRRQDGASTQGCGNWKATSERLSWEPCLRPAEEGADRGTVNGS